MSAVIRVLFIARYHDPTMDRKVALMAQNRDLCILQVHPRGDWSIEALEHWGETLEHWGETLEHWGETLEHWGETLEHWRSVRRIAIPLVGKPDDPHRTLYCTLDFGMRSFRPHLIHAEEEPDSLAALQIALARRLFAPQARLVLYTWQNIDRPRAWFVRLVMGLTLRASDGVLCANREAEEILKRRGYRGLIEVIPAIGVDTQTFKPCTDAPPVGGDAPTRTRDSIGNMRVGASGRRSVVGGRRLVVGYIGRLVPEKGIETLIDAVAMLDPNVELAIIGTGRERNVLEERARRVGLGKRAHFYPAVPPAEVARRLCELDVLVLPSRTTRVWKEQFGRVLAEAMACKVPVIGSDSGAIPEVIGDAGMIFPEGDAAALADCLRRMMESPELRRELAERGYARAMRLFSQERIAERTTAYYRKIGNLNSQMPSTHA